MTFGEIVKILGTCSQWFLVENDVAQILWLNKLSSILWAVLMIQHCFPGLRGDGMGLEVYLSTTYTQIPIVLKVYTFTRCVQVIKKTRPIHHPCIGLNLPILSTIALSLG